MAESYDAAMVAFVEADQNYKMIEKALLEGDFIPGTAIDGPTLKQQYLGLVQEVKDALEERNVRLKTLQNELRQKVMLEPSKWRGPRAKPALLNVGPFKVSSVTKRTFDAKALFNLCQAHGIYERLMELKTLDKDGKEQPLVKQEWDIDFEGVLSWLEANQLKDVIDGAYDEKESTPQVKGPKRLTFLGDEEK